MAVCIKCNRVLSANGSCLYCGTLMGLEAAGGQAPRRRANWIRRILLAILAALLGHFFLFNPTGRGLLRSLLDTAGLSKYLPL